MVDGALEVEVILCSAEPTMGDWHEITLRPGYKRQKTLLIDVGPGPWLNPWVITFGEESGTWTDVTHYAVIDERRQTLIAAGIL